MACRKPRSSLGVHTRIGKETRNRCNTENPSLLNHCGHNKHRSGLKRGKYIDIAQRSRHVRVWSCCSTEENQAVSYNTSGTQIETQILFLCPRSQESVPHRGQSADPRGETGSNCVYDLFDCQAANVHGFGDSARQCVMMLNGVERGKL